MQTVHGEPSFQLATPELDLPSPRAAATLRRWFSICRVATSRRMRSRRGSPRSSRTSRRCSPSCAAISSACPSAARRTDHRTAIRRTPSGRCSPEDADSLHLAMRRRTPARPWRKSSPPARVSMPFYVSTGFPISTAISITATTRSSIYQDCREEAGRITVSPFRWASVFPGAFQIPPMAKPRRWRKARVSPTCAKSHSPPAARPISPATPRAAGNDDLVMMVNEPATPETTLRLVGGRARWLRLVLPEKSCGFPLHPVLALQRRTHRGPMERPPLRTYRNRGCLLLFLKWRGSLPTGSAGGGGNSHDPPFQPG